MYGTKLTWNVLAPETLTSGATAIAVVMLVFSFIILLGINLLQWAGRRRAEA